MQEHLGRPKNDPSPRSQTGEGPPNGSMRREVWSSEIAVLGMTPAVPPNRGGPKPGWAYRTGSEGGNPELRNSKLSDFRQHRRNTNSLRGFLKNSSVASVAGEHPQLSPKDFQFSSTMDRFLPGITSFLAEFRCRFRTRSRMFALGWLTVAWEWLERALGVFGLCFGSVIS